MLSERVLQGGAVAALDGRNDSVVLGRLTGGPLTPRGGVGVDQSNVNVGVQLAVHLGQFAVAAQFHQTLMELGVDAHVFIHVGGIGDLAGHAPESRHVVLGGMLEQGFSREDLERDADGQHLR